MDTNWRPTQSAGDPAMESGDWRAPFQRQRIVNKIMDTLTKHLPFTGYLRIQELKKIAERVEQESYTSSTTQSEYSRKTCFMILTLETRLQSPMSHIVGLRPSVPFSSISGNPNGEDWQEEVYRKIRLLKKLYEIDLRRIQGARGAVDCALDPGDWRAPLRADSRQRVVNKIFDTLKKCLPFSGPEGLKELKKLAERFEGKMYTVATSKEDYLRKISLKMLTMESRSKNRM